MLFGLFIIMHQSTNVYTEIGMFINFTFCICMDIYTVSVPKPVYIRLKCGSISL